MVSVWPQWWQPVGGPRDKIWDLVALVLLVMDGMHPPLCERKPVLLSNIPANTVDDVAILMTSVVIKTALNAYRPITQRRTKSTLLRTVKALSLMPCVPYRPLVSTKAAARSSLTTMCMTICVIGGFCRHPDHNLSSISVFQYHRRTTRILALNLHATSSQSHCWPWLILVVRAAWWA